MILKSVKICCLGVLSILSLKAAGPKPAVRNNDIGRIDSLTRILLTNIPSHNPPVTTGYTNYSRSKFEDDMKLLGSTIPFDYHYLVDRQIRYLLTLGPNYYNMIHERMSVYFPIFEEILDRNNLPVELKYVSVIESNLNPNAVSWCGATGLWQFMPYTGKNMGMKINYNLDERKSILTSTQKASEYFRNSFYLFDDWLLSIASYNCGPGNVNKAIRRAGGGKKTFWQILPYLPKETQNYVPKFIAMAYVLNFTEHSIFPEHNTITSVLVPTKIDTTLHLGKVCQVIGHHHNTQEIIHANRELLTQNTGVATNNTVLLPYDASMSLMENYDSAMEFAAMASPYGYQYTYNQVPRNRRHGRQHQQSVAITAEPANTSAEPIEASNKSYHVVRKGQTLHSIATANGLTVDQLKKWNRLSSNSLVVGKKIYLREHRFKNKKRKGRHRRNYR